MKANDKLLDILVFSGRLFSTLLHRRCPRSFDLFLLLQYMLFNPVLVFLMFFVRKKQAFPLHDGVVEPKTVIGVFIDFHKGGQLVNYNLFLPPVPEVFDFLT